jgi:hypothetical protein
MGDPAHVTPEQFAEGLSGKALHCRELGHTWRPRTVSRSADGRGYERTLLCASCRTVRLQVLDGSCHVVSNSYRYPDGYLAAKGHVDGHVTRDVFRLESILRFVSAAEQKAS